MSIRHEREPLLSLSVEIVLTYMTDKGLCLFMYVTKTIFSHLLTKSHCPQYAIALCATKTNTVLGKTDFLIKTVLFKIGFPSPPPIDTFWL